ncbi:MAG: NAD(P)H-dependent oxidoreductase [Erysipelotrichales bacterium]|nr:NAD(P)H-dependent oxidoreductase [Erysipelotrichales bacterium]
MNICVINGSPKGNYSITLQTILYLEKLFPNHHFEVLHVGQQIRAFEKDFSKAEEVIKNSDLLLFSYPVYTFIAPSQLHRFIKLLKDAKLDLNNKFATQITTSKHFYDVTAHRYVEDNCYDMGIKYIKGLSADMDDLLTAKGQQDAKKFMEYVEWCMNNDYHEIAPITYEKTVPVLADTCEDSVKRDGDVVIITDATEDDISLNKMIERFQKRLPIKSRIVNLNDVRMDGGCLGCFNCAVDGKCIYKDAFDDYLRNQIQTADSIIYAYTIKDHSMGALFKTYDDRNFCNGHRTVTMGMPLGYLVSGNVSKEFNLQMIMEARSEVGSNFLAGVASDEINPNREIDQLVERLVYALEHKYVQPSNFYGVGGMKIFRDLIYLMQGMMKADHKFYKAHNQYDFPQKHRGRLIMMYLVGFMLATPSIKAKLGNKMNEGMLAPYKKLFKEM